MTGREVEAKGIGDSATLSNALHAFDCLWDLRYSDTEVGKKILRIS